MIYTSKKITHYLEIGQYNFIKYGNLLYDQFTDIYSNCYSPLNNWTNILNLQNLYAVSREDFLDSKQTFSILDTLIPKNCLIIGGYYGADEIVLVTEGPDAGKILSYNFDGRTPDGPVIIFDSVEKMLGVNDISEFPDMYK